MTWSQMWLQVADVGSTMSSIIQSIPSMIISCIFAFVTFSALWALVKLIREIRS